MSISETITSMNTNLSLAYSKCAEKGATIPENKNLDNLADTIDTVQGGSEQPYTLLEYIESTGTQYIDTGFKHNQDTRMYANLEIISLQNWANIFGSMGGSSRTKFMFIGETESVDNFYFYYGNLDGVITKQVLGKHIMDFNKNVVKIDDASYTFSTKTFQSETNDLIFGAYKADGKISTTTGLRFSLFQMYDNGTLVRNYIPAMRNSDNVVGMLDTANDVFYENKGTGVFLAGPALPHTLTAIYVDKYGQTEYEVGDSFSLDGYTIKAVYSDGAKVDVTSECTFSPSTLASDTTAVTISYTENGVTETCDVDVNAGLYRFVNYIQSTGTQWINTNYIFTTKTNIKAKVNISQTNSTYEPIFGCSAQPNRYGNSWANMFDFFATYGGNVAGYRRAGAYATGSAFPLNTDVTIQTNIRSITYNGNTISLSSSYSLENGANELAIFAEKAGDSTPKFLFSGIMKLSYFQILEDDEVIRDFVPVVRKTDNAVGLLDKVNNVFYGNNGSGTFLWG